MACDAVQVGDVAFVAAEHGRENGLGHIDQACYVGGEHDF